MRKIFTFISALVFGAMMTANAGSFKLAGLEYVTDANASGIVDDLDALENVTASGTISYDAASNTLTLDNATIECANYWDLLFISTSTTLTINLIGDNTFSQSQTTSGTYFSGINLYDNNANLTITGSGKLVVKSYKYYPIRIQQGSLTIDNTTIEAYSTNPDNYYGIGHNSEGGYLTIKNSLVKAKQISYLKDITLTNSKILQPANKYLSIGDYTAAVGKAILSGDSPAYDVVIVPDEITVDGLLYKSFSLSYGNRQYYVPAQAYTNASLTIPDSITYEDIKFQVHHIYVAAFQNNTNITSVDLKCESIWGNAFMNCTNLATVTLREGIKEISEFAFTNIGATSLALPSTISDFPNSGCPFYGNKFTEITFPNGNANFIIGDDGALYNKTKTTLIAFPYASSKPFSTIPESVTTIKKSAFQSYKNLPDTLILPENLSSASEAFMWSNVKCVIVNSRSVEAVFKGSSSVEEVIFGKTVQTVGQLMFSGDNIKKVTVLSDELPAWQYDNAYSYASLKGEMFANATLYVHCGQGELVAPKTTTWGQFTHVVDTLMYNIDVTAVNATVDMTTTDCNKVTVTVTPNDGYAFVNWDNGETNASFDCIVTSDTAISANIKKILAVGETFRSNTIEGVPVLYKVLTNAAGDKTVQVGEYASPSWSRPNAIAKATAGEVTIPDSAVYFDEKFEVVKIDQYAFYTCNSVTALHLPNTITLIDGLGVNELTGLKEVNIPNTLERTGRYNFAYMNVLKSITLPSSVKYLDYGTFASNYVLEEIVGWDPSKIERMGRIQWYTNSPIWNNTDYFQTENDIRYMGDIAISLPNSESIEIKEGTRVVVGGSTISACKNISIPSTVEAMSAGVIYQCTLLETCTIKAVTPPLIYDSYDVMTELDANGLRKNASGTYPLYGSNPTPEDVKYYVPKEAVATYKANDKWNMLDIRPIGGWTVSFRDHNQNNIIAPQEVEQGTAANRPESVETYYTEAYMYVFADEWTATIVNTGDTIYDAVYNQLPLPTHYVCFYETEADALAQTNRKYRVEKTHFESAEANAAIAVTKLTPRECQMVTGWNGGDITNVTEELHVWPIWGDGKYSVIFFDPIGDAAIKTYENKECGDGVDEPLESEIPVHAGKKFTGWDTDAWQYLEHMLGDLTVNAVYVDDATGIGNVEADMSVQKIMVDGQLYILRGDKVFTVTGQEVK